MLVEAVDSGRTNKKSINMIQGGSNMTGINCDLFTHNQSRSYLNYLVQSCYTFDLVSVFCNFVEAV